MDKIWEHRWAQLAARPGGGSGCAEDSARHRPQSPRDGVAGETRDDFVPPTGLVWLLALKPGLCSGASAPLPGSGESCTQPGGWGMADRLAALGPEGEQVCTHLGSGEPSGDLQRGSQTTPSQGSQILPWVLQPLGHERGLPTFGKAHGAPSAGTPQWPDSQMPLRADIQ